MMKVGDLVTFKAHQAKHGVIECPEVGIVKKIVPVHSQDLLSHAGVSRFVYHILWPAGLISNQFGKELTILSKV